MNLIIGNFYYVKTASGSDMMKLVAVAGNKATFSTFNTFGYAVKAKPMQITVDQSQIIN